MPDLADFDAVCDACGAVLERPEVARWITSTFPIVAIDEAQELKTCRLRIVSRCRAVLVCWWWMMIRMSAS
jgi:hypothetical protein